MVLLDALLLTYQSHNKTHIMKPLEHIIIENGYTDCIEEAIEIIKGMIQQWKDGVHVHSIFREYNIPAVYQNAFYQYDYLLDDDDDY